MTSTCTVDCFSQQFLLAIGPSVRRSLFAFLLIFANKVCFLLSFFLSIWLGFLADACLGACVVYADLWRKKENLFQMSFQCMKYILCSLSYYVPWILLLQVIISFTNYVKISQVNLSHIVAIIRHPAVGSQKFNTSDHVCNHHQKLCQHPYLWFLASSGVGKDSETWEDVDSLLQCIERLELFGEVCWLIRMSSTFHISYMPGLT